MGSSLLEGFTKSLAMTVLSEIGDKTFFAAAILAMRHPRRLVLAGCLTALIIMTILSVLMGWAAPNLISRQWTHHITTVLFLGFGLWSLWEAFAGDGESEELAEVEAKLDGNWKAGNPGPKGTSKDNDDFKKLQKRFLMQIFSPIFLKAFSITFFGEWGDKSQIATIGLASDSNPFGVVLGGIIGQALCTTAAVFGGKSLAKQISEKMISRQWTHHITTVLFLGFGLWSLWEAFTGDGESEELAEVEAKLDGNWKAGNPGPKGTSKDNDDLKKLQKRFLMQIFSPIFLKAFSITFFGEWGDKSQIATIGLASDSNPFGVVLGGIIGQALCTTAAVFGGKSLATQISEKMVALSSGILFLVFGAQSVLASATHL